MEKKVIRVALNVAADVRHTGVSVSESCDLLGVLPHNRLQILQRLLQKRENIQ